MEDINITTGHNDDTEGHMPHRIRAVQPAAEADDAEGHLPYRVRGVEPAAVEADADDAEGHRRLHSR